MWIKEFSNFHMPEDQFILHEHIMYPSVEHFFVAMMYKDVIVRLQVATMEHPNDAKRFGKGNERRADWHKVKRSVMLYALRQKFSDPALRKLLDDTGEAEIVHEVHWHDNYWASCVCPACQGKPKKNLLGELLMKIRDEIREQGDSFGQSVAPRHSIYYGTQLRREGYVGSAG